MCDFFRFCFGLQRGVWFSPLRKGVVYKQRVDFINIFGRAFSIFMVGKAITKNFGTSLQGTFFFYPIKGAISVLCQNGHTHQQLEFRTESF